uniref:Neur_chan_LBD domain-containing protein n=1 Tax=Rhabditophanes sp. KR3021 TaxID=114890 RepID=A0AC35THI2_9BILA
MFILSLFILIPSLSNSISPENRLFEDLFGEYNKLIRPVANASQPIDISFKLKLSQIRDVNEREQIITINGWLYHEWHDYRLEWDPIEYGNVTMIHVPGEIIFLPDIILYNNARSTPWVMFISKVDLYFNGTIVWEPPVEYNSVCSIDTQWFPYDAQTCLYKFGSWSFSGLEIDISPPDRNTMTMVEDDEVWNISYAIDISEFIESVEWDVIAIEGIKHRKKYPCCDKWWIDITYYINIRRRKLYFTFYFIIPCIILASTTSFVFYLPSESHNKIQFSVSLLVALTIFYLLLVEIIPPTSISISLIGKYLLFTLLVVSMSIICTVIILNIHHREDQVMPHYIRYFFIQFLGKYILVFRESEEVKQRKKERYDIRLPSLSVLRVLERHFMRSHGERLKLEHVEKTRNKLRIINKMFEGFTITPITTQTNQPIYEQKADISEINKKIERVGYNIRFISKYLKKARLIEELGADWRFVATVLDRILLAIFSVIILIGTQKYADVYYALYVSEKPNLVTLALTHTAELVERNILNKDVVLNELKLNVFQGILKTEYLDLLTSLLKDQALVDVLISMLKALEGKEDVQLKLLNVLENIELPLVINLVTSILYAHAKDPRENDPDKELFHHYLSPVLRVGLLQKLLLRSDYSKVVFVNFIETTFDWLFEDPIYKPVVLNHMILELKQLKTVPSQWCKIILYNLNDFPDQITETDHFLKYNDVIFDILDLLKRGYNKKLYSIILRYADILGHSILCEKLSLHANMLGLRESSSFKSDPKSMKTREQLRELSVKCSTGTIGEMKSTSESYKFGFSYLSKIASSNYNTSHYIKACCLDIKEDNFFILAAVKNHIEPEMIPEYCKALLLISQKFGELTYLVFDLLYAESKKYSQDRISFLVIFKHLLELNMSCGQIRKSVMQMAKEVILSGDIEKELATLELLGDLNSRDRTFFDLVKPFFMEDIRSSNHNERVSLAKIKQIVRICDEDEKSIEFIPYLQERINVKGFMRTNVLQALCNLAKNEGMELVDAIALMKSLFEELTDQEKVIYCEVLSCVHHDKNDQELVNECITILWHLKDSQCEIISQAAWIGLTNFVTNYTLDEIITAVNLPSISPAEILELGRVVNGTDGKPSTSTGLKSKYGFIKFMQKYIHYDLEQMGRTAYITKREYNLIDDVHAAVKNLNVDAGKFSEKFRAMLGNLAVKLPEKEIDWCRLANYLDYFKMKYDRSSIDDIEQFSRYCASVKQLTVQTVDACIFKAMDDKTVLHEADIKHAMLTCDDQIREQMMKSSENGAKYLLYIPILLSVIKGRVMIYRRELIGPSAYIDESMKTYMVSAFIKMLNYLVPEYTVEPAMGKFRVINWATIERGIYDKGTCLFALAATYSLGDDGQKILMRRHLDVCSEQILAINDTTTDRLPEWVQNFANKILFNIDSDSTVCDILEDVKNGDLIPESTFKKAFEQVSNFKNFLWTFGVESEYIFRVVEAFPRDLEIETSMHGLLKKGKPNASEICMMIKYFNNMCLLSQMRCKVYVIKKIDKFFTTAVQFDDDYQAVLAEIESLYINAKQIPDISKPIDYSHLHASSAIKYLFELLISLGHENAELQSFVLACVVDQQRSDGKGLPPIIFDTIFSLNDEDLVLLWKLAISNQEYALLSNLTSASHIKKLSQKQREELARYLISTGLSINNLNIPFSNKNNLTLLLLEESMKSQNNGIDVRVLLPYDSKIKPYYIQHFIDNLNPTLKLADIEGHILNYLSDVNAEYFKYNTNFPMIGLIHDLKKDIIEYPVIADKLFTDQVPLKSLIFISIFKEKDLNTLTQMFSVLAQNLYDAIDDEMVQNLWTLSKLMVMAAVIKANKFAISLDTENEEEMMNFMWKSMPDFFTYLSEYYSDSLIGYFNVIDSYYSRLSEPNPEIRVLLRFYLSKIKADAYSRLMIRNLWEETWA